MVFRLMCFCELGRSPTLAPTTSYGGSDLSKATADEKANSEKEQFPVLVLLDSKINSGLDSTCGYRDSNQG